MCAESLIEESRGATMPVVVVATMTAKPESVDA
ncbi:MAG: hypothetical protein K0R01_1357, partial [Mycobacterium sp.]|nr:hypothetical protein [Mycobacterium sp.]